MNAVHIDQGKGLCIGISLMGYLVDGDWFDGVWIHVGYLMGGAKNIRGGNIVYGYQFHGNIANCGDRNGDINGSSKLEYDDLRSCSSTYGAVDTHTYSMIESVQGAGVPLLSLI